MYQSFYESVLNNKPVLIRQFLTSSQLTKMKEYCAHPDKTYNIGPAKAHVSNKQPQINTDITNGLENDPRIYVDKKHRIWKHNKNNLTNWHWDGNGADLLNISISGSKEFYLAPPDSFPTLPISCVSLPGIDYKETIKVILEPGDMLYLPAYWFHKVITLEDNTVNINYAFYPKKRIESNRATDLHNIHKMFNTLICKDEIMCTLERPDTRIRASIRAMVEIIPFVIIFYLLCSIIPMYIIIFILIILSIIYNEAYLGFINVMLVYIGIWVILIETIKYFYKKRNKKN